MLKVILADDEEIIREGILNGIDWNSLGLEVVGQAEDGEQALEIAKDTQPDIIITDIRMPFISGLDFIERIVPILPEAYIIIISGHDEFGYAQKALKLGAYDYILKPIELEYLNDILIKIAADYEQKSRKKDEVSSLKEKAAVNTEFFKECFFKDLALGKISSDEIGSKLKEFDLGSDGIHCSVVAIQMDDYYTIASGLSDDERRDLEIGFCSIIRDREKYGSSAIFFEEKAGECIVCVMDKYKGAVKQKVLDLCSDIREKVGKVGQYTVTIAIGNTYDSISALSKSYKEAIEALTYKFIAGKNRNIFFESLNSEQRNEFYALDCNDVELISLIKTASKDQIQERLKALLEDIKQKGSHSYLYMQIVVSSIYMQALRALKDAGGTAEEVFAQPIEVYNKIMSHQTVEGIIGELSNAINNITDYIHTKRSGKFNLVIERVKEYIKKNYAKDDLSLETVANYVNISSCYFSVVFKQEVGETFIDYLTRVRIEKAKELLSVPGYKTYEISYMVGYNNPTYFSTTFKKYTGSSPTEYRDNCSRV